MPNGLANGFLDSLSSSDFDTLAPLLIDETLAWKETLAEPGDVVKYVYFPDGAVLSILKLMRDGRAVEVNTTGREGAFGLLHAVGQPISFNHVIAQISGRCQKVQAGDLRRLAHASPTLLESIVGHLQSTPPRPSSRSPATPCTRSSRSCAAGC